jgi:hypothetical protein
MLLVMLDTMSHFLRGNARLERCRVRIGLSAIERSWRSCPLRKRGRSYETGCFFPAIYFLFRNPKFLQ